MVGPWLDPVRVSASRPPDRSAAVASVSRTTHWPTLISQRPGSSTQGTGSYADLATGITRLARRRTLRNVRGSSAKYGAMYTEWSASRLNSSHW